MSDIRRIGNATKEEMRDPNHVERMRIIRRELVRFQGPLDSTNLKALRKRIQDGLRWTVDFSSSVRVEVDTLVCSVYPNFEVEFWVKENGATLLHSLNQLLNEEPPSA